MVPSARFDDHSPHKEHAFALRGLRDTIVARRTDDVVPALRAVEEASRDGLWCGGYVAYEAAGALDAGLRTVSRDASDPFRHLPLVWFGVFDRRVAEEALGPRPEGPPRYSISTWHSDVSETDFVRSVAAIDGHLAAGRTRQVNLTFRLRAAFAGDADELYRDLVLSQRGAYAGAFDVGRYRVLSASPELFFRAGGGSITCRPMKGTIRRGRWPAEDAWLAARLLASPKERAENEMIVEQVSADMASVAVEDTVRVTRRFDVERYETLWQLTSEVRGSLAPDTGLVDVLRALFPSSSVTGTPKVPTMEVISSLEPSPRGVYTGAFGYVAPWTAQGLSADFNVAIRTVTIDTAEGIAEYGVGGAITGASSAAAEYQEARLKARLLVDHRPEFELVEKLRWDDPTGFVLLDRHIDRFLGSAHYFGFPAERDVVLETLDKAMVGAEGDQLVILTAGRDGVPAVLRSSPLLDPFCDEPPGTASVHVAVSDRPINSENVFVYHKTSNRKAFDKRAGEHPIADDVIVVNERGDVAGLGSANLMIRTDGRWWTPVLESGCLPGTFRAELLASGVCAERVIARSEIEDAEHLAAVDSVHGWRSVQILEEA